MSVGVLGVSHIVARVASLDATLSGAAACGCRVVFDQANAAIPPSKAALLRERHGVCRFALVRPARGPALELFEYPLPAKVKSANFRVEGGVPPGLPAARDEGGGAGVSEVVLACADVERSFDFWRRAIGAIPRAGAGAARTLAIRAPHPSLSLGLSIVPEGTPSDDALDDAGWNCLSFLVRDARAAAERLKEFGGRVRVPLLEYVAGGRAVRLSMAHCPDGRIVEFLELPSGSLPA